MQHKKRKAKEEKRLHVTPPKYKLSTASVNSVAASKLMETDFTDVKHCINIAQTVFKSLHHLWRDSPPHLHENETLIKNSGMLLIDACM